MQQNKIKIDKDLWADPYTLIVDNIKYLLQQFQDTYLIRYSIHCLTHLIISIESNGLPNADALESYIIELPTQML